MNDYGHYVIRTATGILSTDTFAIAPQQPRRITPGCFVVINERDGSQATVHQTRLMRVEGYAPRPRAETPKIACLKCGHVEGIAGDEVTCPYHGDSPCGLPVAAT